MAKSNPNIPTVDITLASPVNQYVLQGVVTGVPPTGASYAGIFAQDCILQAADGSGIYINSGTTALPSWTKMGPVVSSKVTAALGTTQNSTPTAAQLIGGIVTQTGATGAGTVTLPTGTVLSAALPTAVAGDTFDCIFANVGGGQTLTITAGASGITLVGTAAVPTGKTARLTFVCTAANTWTVYINLSA